MRIIVRYMPWISHPMTLRVELVNECLRTSIEIEFQILGPTNLIERCSLFVLYKGIIR